MKNKFISAEISNGLTNVRAFAAILVILIHSASQDLYVSSPHWWMAAVADAFSRCGVPLFLMLSGSLLIRPDIHMPTFIKKRVVRILPPLIFWGVAYVLFVRFYWGWTTELTLDDFKKIAYSSPYIHMWYLYSIIGLYLSIPLISKWYINTDLQEKTIYIAIITICNVIYQIKGLGEVLNFYGMSVFVSYLNYFILGAFIVELNEKDKFKKPKSVYLAIYCITSILIAFITWRISKINGTPSFDHLNYNNPLIAISAVAVFVFFLKINTPIKIFNLVSRLSLGIYCIHMMWLAPTNKFISGYALTYPFRLSIMTLSVLILSAASIFIMSKIKPFKLFI